MTRRCVPTSSGEYRSIDVITDKDHGKCNPRTDNKPNHIDTTGMGDQNRTIDIPRKKSLFGGGANPLADILKNPEISIDVKKMVKELMTSAEEGATKLRKKVSGMTDKMLYNEKSVRNIYGGLNEVYETIDNVGEMYPDAIDKAQFWEDYVVPEKVLKKFKKDLLLAIQKRPQKDKPQLMKILKSFDDKKYEQAGKAFELFLETALKEDKKGYLEEKTTFDYLNLEFLLRKAID